MNELSTAKLDLGLPHLAAGRAEGCFPALDWGLFVVSEHGFP